MLLSSTRRKLVVPAVSGGRRPDVCAVSILFSHARLACTRRLAGALVNEQCTMTSPCSGRGAWGCSTESSTNCSAPHGTPFLSCRCVLRLVDFFRDASHCVGGLYHCALALTGSLTAPPKYKTELRRMSTRADRIGLWIQRKCELREKHATMYRRFGLQHRAFWRAAAAPGRQGSL